MIKTRLCTSKFEHVQRYDRHKVNEWTYKQMEQHLYFHGSVVQGHTQLSM